MNRAVRERIRMLSPQEGMRRPTAPWGQKDGRGWRCVILSNDAGRLRRSVRSIVAMHGPGSVERVIVVDDGARAGWTDADPRVSWVDGARPFVYARNANIGIAAADPDDVVLMGDDCLVGSVGAFDALQETARTTVGPAAVSAGVEGPVGNPTQAWRGRRAAMPCDREIAFVCVYIPREALSIVGKLDERFVGYGLEDVDFCWRALREGLSLWAEDRARVLHNAPGMASAWRSRPDLGPQWERNKQLLREKWGTQYP